MLLPDLNSCRITLLQVYSTAAVSATVPWPATNVTVNVTTPRGHRTTTSTATTSVWRRRKIVRSSATKQDRRHLLHERQPQTDTE